MSLQVAAGWEFDVERGPHCLFVRLHAPANIFEEDASLARRIWDTLDNNLCRRVVIEMDELTILPSYLIGQLIQLQKRVHANDGFMRICGLRPECASLLEIHRLGDRLYPYADRHAAVMGHVVAKPR